MENGSLYNGWSCICVTSVPPIIAARLNALTKLALVSQQSTVVVAKDFHISHYSKFSCLFTNDYRHYVMHMWQDRPSCMNSFDAWHYQIDCLPIDDWLLLSINFAHVYGSVIRPYNCSDDMMTSPNGNIYRVTGHLCGELSCFLWSAPE